MRLRIAFDVSGSPSQRLFKHDELNTRRATEPKVEVRILSGPWYTRIARFSASVPRRRSMLEAAPWRALSGTDRRRAGAQVDCYSPAASSASASAAAA
jgi:hypothetical protein